MTKKKKSPRNPKYDYTTKNNLKDFIALKKAEKVAETGGERILIRDIEEDIADYCNITRDAVVMVKRGLSQPSLAVALKIAEYFGVPVEEIFSLDCEDK
jgi:DNA-binding XRE family transcriptional regulator